MFRQRSFIPPAKITKRFQSDKFSIIFFATKWQNSALQSLKQEYDYQIVHYLLIIHCKQTLTYTQKRIQPKTRTFVHGNILIGHLRLL